MPTQICDTGESVGVLNEATEILFDLLKIADAAKYKGNKARAVEAISAVYAYIDAVQFRADEEASLPSASTAAADFENHVDAPSPHETAVLRWGMDTEAAAHIVRRPCRDGNHVPIGVTFPL